MDHVKTSFPGDLSLADNPKLRFITFILLYFSQGIPEGITLFAIPTWMAMNDKSVMEIAGYNALVIIPFSLKILLAPVIERYTYLPMGRRKPWLLFGQAGIILSMVALAIIPEPLQNIYLLTLVAIVLHVFIMIQDIATDSLVIDIVPGDQQGKANSLMWSSKTIGTSVTFFAGSWMIYQFGFYPTILVLAFCVLVFMFLPLLIKERKEEKLFPWSAGKISDDAAKMTVNSWWKLFDSFGKVFLLRNSLLMFLFIFVTAAAIHFLRTMLPVFTIQELGWNNIFFSKIFSISNLAGGIFAMVTGGLIIRKFGLLRLLYGSLFFMVFIVFLMLFLQPLWHNSQFVSGFVGIFCTAVTFINIGMFALSMNLCWKRISAFQFTFFMTVFNTGLASGAALLGLLNSLYHWQMLFLIFCVLMIVSVSILRFIRIKKHQIEIEKLENKFLEKKVAKI